MKKPLRLLLLATAALVALVVVLLGLALHSGVQTWAARRALASQAGLKASLGALNAGFQNVDLADLHLERDGAVLTLPVFHAELSVIDAGLNERVNIRRLVAKGWTLDLTKFRFPAAPKKISAAAPRPREWSFVPAAFAADASTAASSAAAQFFSGIFAQAALPFALTLDGVELEGDVLLPPAPGVETGRAHLVLAGGGFAAGHEGALTVDLVVALTGRDTPVHSLTVTGRLTATMDTPRTFSRLGTKVDAAATGPQFPQGVKLSADIAAARDAAGENYALSLAGDARQLVVVRAAFPKSTLKLDGTWKLDVRDADLAPFTLGRALPAFTATGEGSFATDPAFGEVRAAGKLEATADRLDVVRRELAGVGAVSLSSEFDVARRGDALRVERLTAALSGVRPVAHVQALQTFEFDLKTSGLKVADPARDLLDLVLDGVPLAWARPVLARHGVAVTGGDLTGEFTAGARNNGLVLRAKSPLAVTGVAVTRGRARWLDAVDVALTVSADYAHAGWQLDVAPLTASSAGRPLVSLEAKAGQLSGRDQPVKVAGKFSVQLPALLAQPAAGGAVRLTGGEASGTFSASLDDKQEVQASLALADLAADPQLTTEKLPSVNVDLRADFTPDGLIALHAPLVLERDGRKSDLTLTGTLLPNSGNLTVNARLASTQLFVDDATVLAAPLAPDGAAGTAPVETKAAPRRAAAPPWSGIFGQVSLALKKVVYSKTFEATDVTGTLKLDAGAAKFEQVRAGLGDGSEARVSGGLTFDARAAEPFALAADVAVSDFDPAPLFKAINPGQPATVEGRFNVTSRVAGSAASLGGLATAAHGDFQLTSKGGVFRGVPANYSAKVESTGKLAQGVALLGSLAGAVTGRKEYSDIANKAQAVAEFSKLLAAIPYDQLNVVLTRDASLNTVLKDFALISPEMRLTGGGQAAHKRGQPLLDGALAAEFKLRARGHTADLLKYLGALDATTDELGYAACTLPLKVGGTIGKPDTTELNNRLAALAIEKSGALDLLNKLIPGK